MQVWVKYGICESDSECFRILFFFISSNILLFTYAKLFHPSLYLNKLKFSDKIICKMSIPMQKKPVWLAQRDS